MEIWSHWVVYFYALSFSMIHLCSSRSRLFRSSFYYFCPDPIPSLVHIDSTPSPFLPPVLDLPLLSHLRGFGLLGFSLYSPG